MTALCKKCGGWTYTRRWYNQEGFGYCSVWNCRGNWWRKKRNFLFWSSISWRHPLPTPPDPPVGAQIAEQTPFEPKMACVDAKDVRQAEGEVRTQLDLKDLLTEEVRINKEKDPTELLGQSASSSTYEVKKEKNDKCCKRKRWEMGCIWNINQKRWVPGLVQVGLVEVGASSDESEAVLSKRKRTNKEKDPTELLGQSASSSTYEVRKEKNDKCCKRKRWEMGCIWNINQKRWVPGLVQVDASSDEYEAVLSKRKRWIPGLVEVDASSDESIHNKAIETSRDDSGWVAWLYDVRSHHPRTS
jgi:hypothetical protein